jgi:histone deacetylase complex regulatory component SIN3
LPYQIAANPTNYYAFVSSVDFATCKRATPSYRELPAAVLMPPSSGSTPLTKEVLNERYISVATETTTTMRHTFGNQRRVAAPVPDYEPASPSTSASSSSPPVPPVQVATATATAGLTDTRALTRNPFEKELFRIEDERFELDMLST